jgi:hypothetical protein
VIGMQEKKDPTILLVPCKVTQSSIDKAVLKGTNSHKQKLYKPVSHKVIMASVDSRAYELFNSFHTGILPGYKTNKIFI